MLLPSRLLRIKQNTQLKNQGTSLKQLYRVQQPRQALYNHCNGKPCRLATKGAKEQLKFEIQNLKRARETSKCRRQMKWNTEWGEVKHSSKTGTRQRLEDSLSYLNGKWRLCQQDLAVGKTKWDKDLIDTANNASLAAQWTLLSTVPQRKQSHAMTTWYAHCDHFLQSLFQ